MSEENHIIFNYVHCNREDIEAHEKSFNESELRQQLFNKLDELQLSISSVSVELVKEEANATSPYYAMINILGPKTDITVEEKGDTAFNVINGAIHKAIKLSRDHKSKLSI